MDFFKGKIFQWKVWYFDYLTKENQMQVMMISITNEHQDGEKYMYNVNENENLVLWLIYTIVTLAKMSNDTNFLSNKRYETLLQLL